MISFEIKYGPFNIEVTVIYSDRDDEWYIEECCVDVFTGAKTAANEPVIESFSLTHESLCSWLDYSKELSELYDATLDRAVQDMLDEREVERFLAAQEYRDEEN